MAPTFLSTGLSSLRGPPFWESRHRWAYSLGVGEVWWMPPGGRTSRGGCVAWVLYFLRCVCPGLLARGVYFWWGPLLFLTTWVYSLTYHKSTTHYLKYGLVQAVGSSCLYSNSSFICTVCTVHGSFLCALCAASEGPLWPVEHCFVLITSHDKKDYGCVQMLWTVDMYFHNIGYPVSLPVKCTGFVKSPS